MVSLAPSRQRTLAQRARSIVRGTRGGERTAKVPELLVQVGGARRLTRLERTLRGVGMTAGGDQLLDGSYFGHAGEMYPQAARCARTRV